MAAIHSKNTKPEMLVRRYLWRHGFRFRINYSRLPGKPDIVLRKYRTCIFVNGCFWHGHNVVYDNGAIQSSSCCRIPVTNEAFWVNKINRNRERDHEVMIKLAHMGWHTITVWECELRPKQRDNTLNSLVYTLNDIFLKDMGTPLYDFDHDDEEMLVAEDDGKRNYTSG